MNSELDELDTEIADLRKKYEEIINEKIDTTKRRQVNKLKLLKEKHYKEITNEKSNELRNNIETLKEKKKVFTRRI